MPPIRGGKVSLPPVPTLSPYRQHCERWKSGCGATICERASRVVIGKGSLPADILFLAEAPGQSEDAIGIPLIGPAGKLLDKIIRDAIESTQQRRQVDGLDPLRMAFTNLVCCLPLDAGGKKAGEPEPEDIDACRPRLEEFVRLASPRLVVAVGKLSEEYLKPGYKHSVKLPDPRARVVNVIHPAAVLRANLANQGLMVQKAIVTIQNAVEETF